MGWPNKAFVWRGWYLHPSGYTTTAETNTQRVTWSVRFLFNLEILDITSTSQYEYARHLSSQMYWEIHLPS